MNEKIVRPNGQPEVHDGLKIEKIDEESVKISCNTMNIIKKFKKT